MLKYFIKSTLQKLGYKIVPAFSPPPFIPYIEHYELEYRGNNKPASFDLWLFNRDAEQWYKEWLYAADRPTWELDEFGWLISPGDRILEIGCHHGFLTMMLSHCIGPDGFILALDANPENVLVTQAQITLNGLNKRCKALLRAGSNKPGNLTFEWRTNSHVVSASSDKPTYTVPAVTGDMLNDEFGPFNVIKIDVEGYEVEVLQGCIKLLQSHPKLILELHPHFMRDYGYNHDINEVFKLIDIDTYKGTLTRFKNWGHPSPFKISDVPIDTVSYLFLKHQ